MVHVAGPDGGEDYLRFVADEQGDCSCSSSGSCWTFFVDGDISCDDDAVSAVPAGGADPVESVEEGVGCSVACVNAGSS